ncbi:MAG: adenylyltransferase/cytidyltransferase family protein [Candidatus Omnitrophica bacterium]|nr:adenylyltransferase/cytidyltransferase family protein [Candidatus Omnitrophota bacterium]
MLNDKLLSLEALAVKSREFRQRGKRVVLCHGVFDLLHNGHIRHLQKAKEQGDFLLVTLTADTYVNKGPGRPVFAEQLRAEMISALACVDYVAVNHAATAIKVIQAMRPHVYAKGADYKSSKKDLTGNILHEKNTVKKYGGVVYYTDEITFSSSSLLNGYFGVFPEETKRYLQEFRKSSSDSAVIGRIKSLASLRALVFGDAIVDEYCYTSPLGQTGKGNILAVKYDSEEQFAGGALAAANHLSRFVGSVTVAAALGTRPSHEAFIRSKLTKGVRPQFFYIPNETTLVKRRFVDPDLAKLFEVYFYNEGALPAPVDRQVCRWLEKMVGAFDIVVVPDFGNGFITPAMIKILTRKAKFLAVNTQVNSGNRGYHVIHRYPRADFVSLNEPELRLASHNRHDSLETVAASVAKKVGASFIAVTRGTNGALMMDVKKKKVCSVPALSTKVVDRIGAGDCFLSIAGACLAGKLPAETAAFVASAAAALDVQIVCNREPIDPVTLFKYVTTLLK